MSLSRAAIEPENGESEGLLSQGVDLSSGGISWSSLAWPVLLSLLVLFGIGLLTYQPGTLGSIARSINYGVLAGAVGVLAVRVLFSGWRMRLVSQGHLTFRQAVRGQLLWDFASMISPSLIGGGPLAAVLMSRDSRMPVGQVTSVMLFVMLLDQVWFAFAIAILVGASVFINVYPDALGWAGSTFFTLFFLGMLAYTGLFAWATLVRPQVLKTLVRGLTSLRLFRRFRHRADMEMENLLERAALLRSASVGFFLHGFITSVLIWMCRYLSLLMIVWSVHEGLDKTVFFFRSMAMLTGSLLIPTPGGAGGIEGMYALFFSGLMPIGLLAPTLLAWRVLAYYVFLGIGLFLSAQLVSRQIKTRVSSRKNDAPVSSESVSAGLVGFGMLADESNHEEQREYAGKQTDVPGNTESDR